MSAAPRKDTPTGPFRKYFQCIVDAHGEAAKANGLGEVWSSDYKQQFQATIDQMKECDSKNTEDEVEKYVCRS